MMGQMLLRVVVDIDEEADRREGFWLGKASWSANLLAHYISTSWLC